MREKLLTAPQTQRQTVSVFYGLERTPLPRDGAWAEENNLSSQPFPFCGVRAPRATFAEGTALSGLAGGEMPVWTDGTDLVVAGTHVPLGLSAGSKRIVRFGAYRLVFPDGKYVNTADLSDAGSIEASYTSSSSVTFALCREDGEVYADVTVSARAPSSPSDGMLWMDCSGTPALQRYSELTETWADVAAFVRFSSPGIGQKFRAGDGVTVSGCTEPSLNVTAVVTACGENFLVLPGTVAESGFQSAPLTVARRMPPMDFVTECGNRLWGCRYGAGVNEIYASVAGDFRNWNVFEGLASDSYAASVGTDGAFTAAVTHLGYPVFFKENCLHKVYGGYPSEYQIRTVTCDGVQPGSAGSVATVGSDLFYLAERGVFVYDGSLPVCVSQALGESGLSDGSAAAKGERYVLAATEADGTRSLFTYDARLHLWHREDGEDARDLVSCGGEVYFRSGNRIRTLGGVGTADSAPVPFFCRSGTMGLHRTDGKFVTRLCVRAFVPEDGTLSVSVQMDDGTPHGVLSRSGGGTRTLSVPVRAEKGDRFSVCLSGTGAVRILTLETEWQRGSVT